MKRFFRVISLILCGLMIFPFFAACSAKTISYSGEVLDEAKVGEYYIGSVATALCGEDGEGITYELKSGSNLPIGLFLKADGEVSGTPRAKSTSTSFTVVASAEGYESVEAVFSITVLQGVLSYSGKNDLRARLGESTNIDIATATGTDGTISYTLKSGDSLPDGLSLGTNGRITGIAEQEDEVTFRVIASATDCTSAEAEFTIAATTWLDYAGKTLSSGNLGKYYSADIATASGTVLMINYTLKDDNELPDGLSLDNGLLIGTPSALGRSTFTIVAEASGFDSAEATFTINILPALDEDNGEGEITYTGRVLAEGYYGMRYNRLASYGVGTATADNGSTVTYQLENGSALPAGLSLLPDGSIAGIPSAAASEHTFSVVASANGCEPVTAEFTITITAARLMFPAGGLLVPDGKKGVMYNRSVATAYASDGATDIEVTYSVKPGGKNLPAGLTLSPEGVLSGIPTKISKIYSFRIIAEADGYISAENEIVITVHDAEISGVTRFEAEYTNLEGIEGGGFSGGNEGVGLIGGPNGASNGAALVFTHGMTKPVTFNITSSKAVLGVSFYVGLGSEIGDVELDNNVFDIRINGESIPYSIEVPGVGGDNFGDFDSFLVSSDIELPAGSFVVELEVMEGNALRGGPDGGPGIDFIEFDDLDDAVLSWTPWTINLLSDGQEGN